MMLHIVYERAPGSAATLYERRMRLLVAYTYKNTTSNVLTHIFCRKNSAPNTPDPSKMKPVLHHFCKIAAILNFTLNVVLRRQPSGQLLKSKPKWSINIVQHYCIMHFTSKFRKHRQKYKNTANFPFRKPRWFRTLQCTGTGLNWLRFCVFSPKIDWCLVLLDADWLSRVRWPSSLT